MSHKMENGGSVFISTSNYVNAQLLCFSVQHQLMPSKMKRDFYLSIWSYAFLYYPNFYPFDFMFFFVAKPGTYGILVSVFNQRLLVPRYVPAVRVMVCLQFAYSTHLYTI